MLVITFSSNLRSINWATSLVFVACLFIIALVCLFDFVSVGSSRAPFEVFCAAMVKCMIKAIDSVLADVVYCALFSFPLLVL